MLDRLAERLLNVRAETRSAIDAVRAVLPLLRSRRGADEVREKAPNDLVTATDVLVQSTLQQILAERHPDIAFVGEESGLDLPSSAPRQWLVDPICGTSNYAAGLPLFATNVALVEDGHISLSAALDGGTGDIYVAEAGGGAWQVTSEGPRRLSVSPANRLVSIDPDTRREPGVRAFPTEFALEALRRRRWEVRALSSTLALVYLANGRLGAAVYATEGAALHVAAGVLLAREAGALVTDHDGAEWSLDSPICVAAASQELHAEVLTLAAEVYTRLTL